MKNENKLIIISLSISLLLMILVSFIEVVEYEEIIFKNEMLIKTESGYDFVLNDEIIKLTEKERDNLYIYHGDKYKVSYKHYRFSDKTKQLVNVKYIYQ